MVDVKMNENGFVDFTPQQVAYLELHKLYGIVDTEIGYYGNALLGFRRDGGCHWSN